MRTIWTDGHAAGDLLGQPDLALGGGTERQTVDRRLHDGVDHAPMGVAQDQRPPRADPIDVLVAVHVDQRRALAAGDEDRVPADRAHRPDGRIDAPGQRAPGPVVELRGPLG